MRLSSLALLAIGSISSAPAFCDLVQITSVNGSVSGSGTAVAANGFGPTFDIHGFSLTGTNTQPGTFTKSGQASASGAPTFGDHLTISGLAEQVAIASGSSADFESLLSATVDGLGAQWRASFALSNQYTVDFVITAPSLMHISTMHSRSAFSSNPDPGFRLDGPSLSFLGLFGSGDQEFEADPGVYELTISDPMNFVSFPGPEFVHLVRTDSLSLTVSTVPEPRLMFIITTLLLVVIRFSSLRAKATRQPSC